MWNIFKLIIRSGITPDQTLCLYSIKEGVSTTIIDNDACHQALLSKNYIVKKDNTYTITNKGNKYIKNLQLILENKRLVVNNNILGLNYNLKIKQYRELFPKGKLPSGVPARNNVKTLTDSFKWFFQTYDYSWDTIIKATTMYVNEYSKDEYLYMQNSKYFIKKQDKHKGTQSGLADYCDFILDGVNTIEPEGFNETVV